ncbi:carbon storage regulator [Stratiformator vulcanicus]|uniref:Translational regulator CsrA n=1 Tax=Stratiformator vulcanicus TaxID=2527980 RepID=A0A517QVQ9_9PLAN|nr:carbon storage regulator [Stratiformator vulcanicus]QDT35664.1 hypothetical protein Pan189_00170 [Stratiformator vulcanicus]
MLVLQRKSGEEIQIGDDVVIRLLKSSGNRVMIGIEAPDGTSIRRAELTPNLKGKRDSRPVRDCHGDPIGV